MTFFSDFIRQILSSLYASEPQSLAALVVALIVVLFLSSLLLAGLSGFVFPRPLDRAIDHLRQACLNLGVALVAAVTASFVLVQQQKSQDFNQRIERLRNIDASLTYKLDSVTSGIGRLYFTQVVLEKYNAIPSTGGDDAIAQLRALGVILNTAYSAEIAPPIVPADLPGLSSAFSLNGSGNFPFLYSYLSPGSAKLVAVQERQLSIGFAGLTADLTTIGADEIWASLDDKQVIQSKSDAKDLERRTRLSRNIEITKLPAVKFAWLICEYKRKVREYIAMAEDGSRSLDNMEEIIRAPLTIEVDIGGVAPSEFIEKNAGEKGSARRTCSEEVLRSIMLSYVPLFANTGLFDFFDDLYDLKERETEIDKRLKVQPASPSH